MTAKPAIFDPAPVIAAIRAAMPDLREVGSVADLGRLTNATISWPSAYVITLAETPGPNRYQNEHVISQRVLPRFGVIWAVRDIGGQLGDVASGDIRTVRAEGMLAVCGLTYPGADGQCLPVGGRLISGVDRRGQQLWQDDFVVPLNRFIPKSGS